MMYLLFVLLALVAVVIGVSTKFMGSTDEVTFKGEIKYVSADYQYVPLPVRVGRHELIHTDALTNFDWRSVEGINYLTPILNQHSPIYCGSCWAHSTVSMIADRGNIMRKASTVATVPSVQYILNCGQLVGSCNGGDVHALLRWIYEQKRGVVDSTCQPYIASSDQGCRDPMRTCYTCNYTGACYAVDDYPTMRISAYDRVIGDDKIMSEIISNGPVVCYINSDCIEQYQAGTISMYNETYGTGDKCETLKFDHAISIVGWGVRASDGLSFWTIRNSWGTFYGNGGFFDIVRGGAYQPLGCYTATPDV